MKKVLFATTALVLTAGMAMAEVKISGSGRVGLTYDDSRSELPNNPAESNTQIEMRLQFNLDASKETDSGVTFGGRIRIRSNEGTVGALPNTAYVYAEASGFRVEVGNANTAFDSVALMYNSEIGFVGNSQGESLNFNFFSYSSNGNVSGTAEGIGIFAAYSVGDLNARLSYVTPDQTGFPAVEEEIGVSFDYKFGQFTVALAAATNGAGIDGNDLLFLGAEYAINDSTNVGLLYNDNGILVAGGPDVGQTVALYGNTKLASGITLKGYVSFLSGNDIATEDDVAGGIGAEYDLGGATLAGGIETRFSGGTYADLGVNFSF